MQLRSPFTVLAEIAGHASGEEDVPRVAAIHHSLRHVDPAPGDVRAVIHIGNLIDRSAVDAHAQEKVRMLLQGLRDLDRAAHRRIRAGEKCQRHAIARRQPNEFTSRLRGAELLRCANDLIQLPQEIALLIDWQFRVTDNVREQDVRDLEMQIRRLLGSHAIKLRQIA